MTKLPFEIMSDFVCENSNFEFNGVKYSHVTNIKSTEDSDGKYWTSIYKTTIGDGVSYFAEFYFGVKVFLTKYGHKHYSYDHEYNDTTLFEVKKEQQTEVVWKRLWQDGFKTI
jgi:hypothetical protein